MDVSDLLPFLADRRANARLASVVVCPCRWRYVLWLNGAS